MAERVLYPHQRKLLEYVRANPKQKTYHFVAPPGSGKTILGLALVDYLKKKTLILVPSLLLKEQWHAETIAYIGSEAASTKIMIETYQTVYQQLQKDQAYLQKAGFELLVLDEAHHLKKEWGRILSDAREEVDQFVSISLTATPPLSSEQNEWETYLKLNGPIDDEIACAELIKQGLLNPYQDFVAFVKAEAKIEHDYEAFYAKQNVIVERLLNDEEVIELIAGHPFMMMPLNQANQIYAQFELYTGMLIFLNHHRVQIDETHWKILGFKKKHPIPKLSQRELGNLYEWLWENFPELSIFEHLKKEHWLKEDKLSLFPKFPKEKLAGSYEAKMAAIDRIVIKEELNLKGDLSCVVLFDRIQEEAFAFSHHPAYYGVVPQFLRLKELVQKETEIALICGRFLIISERLARTFFAEILDQGQAVLDGFLRINLADNNRKPVLERVTELMEMGHLQVLIGTVALLGEGWDCQSINTVILGNNASSYVQVQQLRGRALRVKANKPLSTIWHLGQYLPTQSWQDQVELAAVLQRLSYIEGISNQRVPDIVTTGVDRLNFPAELSETTLENYNQENFFFAKNRTLLSDFWQQALKAGSHLALPVFIRPQVQEHFDVLPQQKNIAKHEIRRLRFWEALVKGRLSVYFDQYRTRKKWQEKCRLREKLAAALLSALQQRGRVDQNLSLRTEFDFDQFRIQLVGGTYQEERIFNQALTEVMQPVLDARYLVKADKSYFCVPKEFAKSKQMATIFLKAIQKKQMKSELIYTKNTLGRQKLMHAYVESLEEQRIQVTQERMWQ